MDHFLSGAPIEQTERACEMLARHGIKVWGYFLLFQFWEEAGTLHAESAQEVRNSLAFAHRLWKQGHLHYSSWAPAIPVQGAEFYNLALRRGMITNDYHPSDTNWDPRPYLTDVSDWEYKTLMARARWLQARMAFSAGAIEWRNWRAILYRARPLLPFHYARSASTRHVHPHPVPNVSEPATGLGTIAVLPLVGRSASVAEPSGSVRYEPRSRAETVVTIRNES